jgi:hypothetical protein
MGTWKPKKKHNFDWEGLEIGKSFNVKIDEIELKHLKSMASKQGKRLGKRFRVIKHSNEIGYEVGRLDVETVVSVESRNGEKKSNSVETVEEQVIYNPDDPWGARARGLMK